tara:strand:+ start:300 stop:473 length:174 start_codon:yes stop_codon:yes gene_type:complete
MMRLKKGFMTGIRIDSSLKNIRFTSIHPSINSEIKIGNERPILNQAVEKVKTYANER